MKKLSIIGAAVAVLLASPAMAAPPVPMPFTWTGCYIGGNFGFVKQDTHVEYEGYTYLGVFNPDYLDYGWSNGVGGAGGGQVGCDYQLYSNWVIGVRGMIDATSINQSLAYGDPNIGGAFGIKTDWFATAVGRIGYLAGPNMLLYVKGGAAWKHVSYSDAGHYFDDESWSGSGSATILGYDVGAGFEYAFFPNLSAFAEIDYMGFPATNTNLAYTCTGECPPSYGETYRYTHDILALLVGMNWRFHP